ncbi:C4-dicarboxylate ABC transporter permease [Jeotgalibaca sp. MA1X17-3]|uniref:YfcC family protein n=1 Tax=Jeotgalibaca sp. MA1X17-3 TaxID=2908211 RepID=UPI001F1A5951|nr:Na+/H+ antiporter NhaC family protein [Jeotgalibaca sp. MA1X17-3]UJF15434.1 C4-dicarboxylate ABC transporter permease [Jeotgalibaca sp. MA1X17-3]
MNKKRNKGFQMPHTYVLLISVMIIMAILTWIIPAGQFEVIKEGTRTVVVPNSWHAVESSPQGFFEIINSIPKGLVESASISIFIFLIGGAFMVINETGMVAAFIFKIAKLLKGRESLVIPVFILIFGITGATLGFSEETIVFIAMGVSLAIALGYDAIVGMSMIALGAAIGFSAGFLNPFTVGIAQGIAELPTFSGMGLRIVMFFVLWIVTSIYVMIYANKIKKDPTKSFMYSPYDTKRTQEKLEEVQMNKRHVAVGIIFAAGMILIAYGVIQYGWFVQEIGAIFMATGIIAGFVYGYGPSKIAELFVLGAKDMIFAALIVGVARSIVIVMEDGMIIDTIVNFLAGSVQILPGAVASVAMYIIQIIINFVIPSGSGQAAATMPIMVPLADAIGITRQTSVLAYQLGSGFMDSIMITSGVLMAQLSVARIPYTKWVRYLAPLMLIWLLIGMAFLLYAYNIGYGPF